MTDSELRATFSSVLEEYTYRLDVRFVTRKEFEALEKDTQKHDSAMLVLRSEFEALRKEVAKLGNIIGRAAWTIGMGLFGAVGAALLNLVLR